VVCGVGSTEGLRQNHTQARIHTGMAEKQVCRMRTERGS
jgi:hypothetical protein